MRQSVSTGGRHAHDAYARSQSPSDVSKISEPCYLSSAPRRRVTADLDRFSDIALSAYAVTAPPSQQRAPAHLHAAPDGARPSMQLPTYEEFHQREVGLSDARSGAGVPLFGADASSSAMPAAEPMPPPPRRQTTAGISDVEASTAVNSAARAHAYHPLLADYGVHRRVARQPSVSSDASRSPFASIRTVSPVIVDERSPALALAATLDLDAVGRAQAEAALEQTILCPLSRTIDAPYSTRGSIKSIAPDGEDGGNGIRQNWARYTGYAIVGFGVGTLVGMMCLDMAASATPRATRTIPIVGM
ncbi:hypothetical protein GGF43_006693 [Coemansia sp. RSA 2618]|nr:hypothetical protein GGF43_006693 [Coemansia sp. RSA 2618]